MAVLAPVNGAGAQAETVLYAFKGRLHGDGDGPVALMRDSSGNLFGATQSGGSCKAHFGCGTVFELSAAGAETVLYAFRGREQDTPDPQSELVEDTAGNLYGTARYGGAHECGYVYKIAPDRMGTIVHNFKDGRDGCYPAFGLVGDGAGNFYGSTSSGGNRTCGCGTVYRITSDGKLTVLHEFKGGDKDAYNPEGGVVFDKDGNVYGTSSGGDGGRNGAGTVYKIAPDGTETLIHVFKGKNDGYYPFGRLLLDQDGNLYGTMVGSTNKCLCGAVFKTAPDGTTTIVYSFTGGGDGKYVQSGLVLDGSGNLYGTTSNGGGTGCSNDLGCGVVFKLAPNGVETVLYLFAGGSDGANPGDGVTADQSGNLYGVTSYGGRLNACQGRGCGVVYEISP